MAVLEDVQQFMSIGAIEEQTKSFEEVRVDDYLKSYTTTGRPPQPCPQEPTGDVARAALGLPPLFKPYTASPPGGVSSTSTAIPGSSTSLQPRPTTLNLADLPAGQEFAVTKIDGESYHSIVCGATYAFFSPEELRYYAYLHGHTMAPSVKMDPFVVSNVTPSSTNPQTTPTPDPRETMQSIVCQPLFAGHSFEELRVAFLLAQRELNSAEVQQFFNQPAPSLSASMGAAAAVPAPIVPGPVLPPVTPGPPLAAQPGPPLTAQSGPAFSFKFGA